LRGFFAEGHKKRTKVKKSDQFKLPVVPGSSNTGFQSLAKDIFPQFLANRNPAHYFVFPFNNPTIMKLTNSFPMKNRMQTLLRQVLLTCLFVSLLAVTLYVLINSPA
jgi:hypothetical protein